MIGQNQRGLVFLSTTTIAKTRAARCGAGCGGEITMMEEKVVRLLVSIRELESSLKKLAESAKEKSADIHSFAKVLREIENLPTIDPESLWPVTHFEPVDPESDIEFKCSKCGGIISTGWDGIEDFEYCPYCGARMGADL